MLNQPVVQPVIQCLGPVAALELERHMFLREPNSALPSPMHPVVGLQRPGICFCGDSGSHLALEQLLPEPGLLNRNQLVLIRC